MVILATVLVMVIITITIIINSSNNNSTDCISQAVEYNSCLIDQFSNFGTGLYLVGRQLMNPKQFMLTVALSLLKSSLGLIGSFGW